jgi:hypothetical protein
MSHQDLYNLLHQGDQGQVKNLSVGWRKMREKCEELTSTLQADLLALRNTWTGDASAEFQRRIDSIVQFSSWVGGEFGQIETATSIMGDQLQSTKNRAESPAAFEGNDHMVSQAASNAATFAPLGPVGSAFAGLVGLVQGHEQDEEARQRAHQRMVNLVADLAAEYDSNAAASLGTDLPAPPAELPGSIESTISPGMLAGIIAAIRALGLFGSGGASAATVHLNSVGSIAPPGHPTTGTPATGAGLAGTGGMVGAAVGSHVTHHGGVEISDGVLLAGGGGLTALGLGLAARSAMGSGAGPGTTGAAGSAIPPRPNTSAESVLGREPDPAAAVNARTGAPRAASGLASGRNTDEPDEHSTWLTEDDMDWGEDDAAEPILGGRPAQPGPSPTSE